LYIDDICDEGACGGGTLKVFKEDTLTGWTIGGGHAVSSQRSVKAEHLDYDFGTIDDEGIEMPKLRAFIVVALRMSEFREQHRPPGPQSKKRNEGQHDENRTV
jgi:hypothetical protein